MQSLERIDTQQNDSENHSDEIQIPQAKEDPKSGSPLAHACRDIHRFLARRDIAKQAPENPSAIEWKQREQIENGKREVGDEQLLGPRHLTDFTFTELY